MRFNYFLAAFSIYLCFLLSHGPVGTQDGSFNSDTAIPIIMANTEALSPYHLYYFGQDRLGGWPFILQWLLRQGFTTGPWEATYAFAFQIFLLTLAVIFAAQILGSKRLWFGGAMVLASISSPLLRQYFFEINNPYAAQAAMGFLYWAVLNRLLKALCAQALPLLSFGMLTGALLILAVLAMWTSPASLCFLASITLWGGLYVWLNRPKTIDRKQVFIFLSLVLSPFLGLIAEQRLRRIYNVYVEKTFAYELKNLNFNVHTPMEFHWQDLPEKLATYLLKWFNDSPGWSLLGLVFIGMSTIRIYCLRIRRKDERRSDAFFAWLVIVCLYTGGILNFIAISGIDWISRHDFNLRYAVPSILLFNIASLLAICCSWHELINFKKPGPKAFFHHLPSIGLLAAILSVLLQQPLKSRWQMFAGLKAKSHLIAQGVEKTLVLGPYFQSYVWQGLNPQSVIGLPSQGHSLRVPWGYKYLEGADRILKCGEADLSLSQYGLSLRIIELAWADSHYCILDLLER